MSSRRPRRAAAVFIGFLTGLSGETLLFMRGQCCAVEKALRDDFKVVLFFDSAGPEREKILLEKVKALPDVREARYVSPEEALVDLRRRDADMAGAVSALGDNPLPSAYEVSLEPEGVGRLAQWLPRAEALNDWKDIRYKPLEALSLLRVQFYGRLVDLVLGLSACAEVGFILWDFWPSDPEVWLKGLRENPWTALPILAPERLRGAVLGVAGGAAGAAACGLTAWPLRRIAQDWAWPSIGLQAALIAAAAAGGWIFCVDGD